MASAEAHPRSACFAWQRRALAGACLAGLLSAPPARGQSLGGTLTGGAVDPDGRPVAGVRVTARHAATGLDGAATTDEQGAYRIPLLPSGEYRVTAEKPGFKTHVQTGVALRSGEVLRLDFDLAVGSVSERIEVSGRSNPVAASSSELGQVIDHGQIQALPLNGRLFQQLVGLTAGTTARGFADFAENPSAAGARSPVHHTVNGVVWSGNAFLLDGVSDVEPLNAYVSLAPPLEAIEEFKVHTQNPPAEYGFFGGAVVSVVIRSGTNELRGSAFGSLRDDALNARGFFAPEKAPFSSRQLGATLGGPIVKDKAFYFADYQNLHQDEGRTQVLSVPTPLMRQGVLSEIGAPIYDPASGRAFPGNVIPAERIDPIARRAAQVWPLPNRPGLADNYVENNVVAQRGHAFDVRLDSRLGESGALLARYSRASRRYDEPAPGNVFMGANNAESTNQNAALGYTRSFGGTRFLEVRLGYNAYSLLQLGEDHGIEKNNELGIPNGNIPGLPYTTGIASFDITGISPTGSPGFTNSERLGTTYQARASFAWARGRHSLKSGADLRLIRATLTNPEVQPRGVFRFDRLYTSDGGREGTGSAWASFLLGFPNQVVRDFVDARPRIGRTLLGLFVQDDFRVGPRLTLNLGLRWDLMRPPREASNQQANFSLTDGLLHLASDADPVPAVRTQLGYWGPRLGLSYTPDRGRTALRAGLGLTYFPDNFGANGGTLERNYPFFQIVQLDAPDPLVPFRSLRDGLPAFAPVPRRSTLEAPAGTAVFYMPPDFHENTVTMLHAGVQRALGQSGVVEATYVGTRGTHLFRARNLNVPAPGPGSLDERRPYARLAPGLSVIEQRAGDGRSWYDALQLTLARRAPSGPELLLSYTWSRSTDTLYTLHPAIDDVRRRSSTFKTADVPHRLSASYVYPLPLGPGRRFLAAASGLLRAIVEGWSISGITTYESGNALAITVAAPLLNTGTDNFADLACARVGLPKRVDRWFDTSCFADPAPYAFGSSRIGDARGPALFNTDLAIAKRTRVRGASLELRVEVFNLFDRAHLGDPNTVYGDERFGRISETRLPPREVQLGLRVQF